MSALGILLCHDNSYPFQERTLDLDQPVKIGRSVARAKAAIDNAIFDCKVLSRNHAVLWYDTYHFYIKDTKSSNGTFVNNKRLSPSGEESGAFEVYSGDIVQFGVDVVESTKKVTHGCIVASLKLYFPNNKEAKSNMTHTVPNISINIEDLHKLNQYIQEAGRREQALCSKLDYIQQLLDKSKQRAIQSWKSIVIEDCLLSRIEMLENKILTYSKNDSANVLRNEIMRLLENKSQYQNASKELLQKRLIDKQSLISKFQILKYQLKEMEYEKQNLYNIVAKNQNELQSLTLKYVEVKRMLTQTTTDLLRSNIKSEEPLFRRQIDNNLNELSPTEIDLQKIEEAKHLPINTLCISKTASNYIALLPHIKYLINSSADNIDLNSLLRIINTAFGKWQTYRVNMNNMKIHNDHCEENKFADNLENIQIFQNDNYYVTEDNQYSMKMDNASFKPNKYILFDRSKNDAHTYIRTFLKLKQINQSKSTLSCNQYLLFRGNQIFSIDTWVMQFIEQFFTYKHILPQNLRHNLEHIGFRKSLLGMENSVYYMYSLQIKLLNLGDSIKYRNRETRLSAMQGNYSPLGNTMIINTNKDILQMRSLKIQPNIRSEVHFPGDSIISCNNCDQSSHQKNDLKFWLNYSHNVSATQKFKEYYSQFIQDLKKIQELNEQLVILKEKYSSFSMKNKIIPKQCSRLSAECKGFVYSTHIISFYYVIPVLLILVSFLLGKIL